MASPRVTVIVNPAAGRGGGVRLIPRLEHLLASLGVDFVMKVSDRPDAPAGLAREAAEQGSEIVAACGGDGLSGAVANGLAGSGAALAVIPTGTGNDFARALGLHHRRPLAAARLLAAPRTRAIDLARVTTDAAERYFVNIAGAGFDSEVNEAANRMRTRLTGAPKYVLALARTLRSFHPTDFALIVDDRPYESPAMMVAVGNGRSYGGGMKVTPDASLTDGLLEICVVQAMRKAEFLLAFPRVFRGTHVSHPKVTMMRGSRVEMRCARAAGVYADGEPAGALPASFDVLPGAIQVVVP